MDVVVATDGSSGTFLGGISVLLNDGNANFSETVLLSSGTRTIWSIATADLNSDGWVDIVAGDHNHPSEGILVFLNDGTGTFGPLQGLHGRSAGCDFRGGQ